MILTLSKSVFCYPRRSCCTRIQVSPLVLSQHDVDQYQEMERVQLKEVGGANSPMVSANSLWQCQERQSAKEVRTLATHLQGPSMC